MLFNSKARNMHNLVSQNQLAEWNHSQSKTDENIKLNDYYACMISARDKPEKRICKEILL